MPSAGMPSHSSSVELGAVLEAERHVRLYAPQPARLVEMRLAEGARVAITGRNQATLDAAAKELGPDVLVLKADVTNAEETERALQAVVERFGKLDVLFANAFGDTVDRSRQELDYARFGRTW